MTENNNNSEFKQQDPVVNENDDENKDQEQEDESTQPPSELDTLKARAIQMGMSFHHNIGIDKLKNKINALLKPETGQTEPEIKPPNSLKEEIVVVEKSPEQVRAERFAERKKNAAKLIRIQVTCMNPNKTKWPGEIISVGSAKLGTFKKYVPFNAPDGWHVPNIIYKAMCDRKCTVFVVATNNKGKKYNQAKMIDEFSIRVMPELTLKEIKKLAERQTAERAID